MVFFIAAASEILILGLMTATWPAKAAEGSVPVAIIACGLAGPFLPGPWYRVGLLGAALGLVNAVAFISLSSDFGVPEKFTVAELIPLSMRFAAATASGTWLWTQFERRRGRSL